MQIFALFMVGVWVVVAGQPASIQSNLAERIKTLTRDSSWKRVAAIPITFPTSGLQKSFWLSARRQCTASGAFREGSAAFATFTSAGRSKRSLYV